ncbi:hypothetical protein D918_03102 [Trichuris suis]|uniref:Uncharacterized protein n=1 Tax=Trichuris suis TaxID=68888 RepID=A0A085M2V9_9BILA|nr:hypothetical protein M513_07605 [Trichuris suis]KHJ46758.1 hypothetical protein D918_03102 [Trichuris suis]
MLHSQASWRFIHTKSVDENMPASKDSLYYGQNTSFSRMAYCNHDTGTLSRLLLDSLHLINREH